MTLAIIDGDPLLYISMWGKSSLKEAKEHLNDVFKGILETLFTEDYVMAVGGPNNFRETFYTEYKLSSSRQKSRSTKPEWFDDLKSYLVSNFEGAVLCDGYEADDLVRVWATECDSKGMDFTVVSIDKDLDCIAGKHYNPRKGELYVIDEKYADRHYWKQILMGDSTDNIPGLPGIGPKKAELILGEGTHEEMKTAVCKAYHAKYGEDGYQYLIANGRLIHIWRSIGDHFHLDRSFYEEAVANE